MSCHLDGAKPLSESVLKYCNLTLRNKLQPNVNPNSQIFIENVFCEMLSISSRSRCIKLQPLGYHNILLHVLVITLLRDCDYLFKMYGVLTLNVRGPSYLDLTGSISWLLMSWLLTSPGHQQPWYWLCKIGRFLSYLRKDFNYLRSINVEKWQNVNICFCSLWKI